MDASTNMFSYGLRSKCNSSDRPELLRIQPIEIRLRRRGLCAGGVRLTRTGAKRRQDAMPAIIMFSYGLCSKCTDLSERLQQIVRQHSSIGTNKQMLTINIVYSKPSQ